MKSQASDTTLVGGGRRDPASEQSNCQTISVTAITISGGSRMPAAWAANSRSRSTAGLAGGRNATISAGAPGTGTDDPAEKAGALAPITPPFLFSRGGERALGVRGTKTLPSEKMSFLAAV